ncbi:MAG TPA: ABC transporter permease [Candidatus Saccharibacteria bacterium]|nr:ABC transporter permease [Candidatus Saccharibacteria bacterium]HRQ07107.1 ABC transporter permease [Candidatus Saccharibacteria bacterium]
MDNFKSKYRYSLILFRELVITDFKIRYQGSALGYLWSLLRPLFMFGILYFVFVHFLRIGAGVEYWPVAMLLGMVLWGFFSEVTSNGMNAIVSRGDVIRKINFPKYVIILASSASALINLLFNLIVIAVFMWVSGVDLHPVALIAPFYVLELLIFGIGLAFLLSVLQVYFRDTAYIWEIISQALFYGSAVIYPVSVVIDQSAFLAKVLLLNPVAQSIQDVRHVLISDVNLTLTQLTSVWWMLVPAGIVVVTFIFGAWLFKKHSPNFAENI